MIIRSANNNDITGISELLRQVCLVHHNGRPDLFQYGKQKYNAAQLEDVISDPLRPIFVAADDQGNILGHAFCIHQEEPNHNVLTPITTLYIDDICVHNNYRKQGIATQLYQYVQEYAKSKNYYNITLNVWAFNEEAQRFYEKCGMVIQKMGMEMILTY